MADLLFIATLMAFFALMVAFVRLCERIVGKDAATSSNSRASSGNASSDSTDVDHTTEEVPA